MSRHAVISRLRLNRRIRSALRPCRNLQDRSSCSGSFDALGKKSLVNWDQDVTSWASRICRDTGTVGSWVVVTPYLTGSLGTCTRRQHEYASTYIYIRMYTYTYTYSAPRRNKGQRPILINYLFANYCNYMLPHPCARTLSIVVALFADDLLF